MFKKTAADTVFINGKVITVDKDFSIKKAIAVKDGVIIDVGENSEIKEYIGEKTEVIDLEGRTIMPGACDAHGHAACFGMQKYCFDCTNDIDMPKFQQMIKERVDKAEPGEWIIGTGFMVDSFKEFEEDPSFTVTKEDIDAVAPDNPVYIQDAGAHNIMVNSKAFEVCGITKDTPDPENGHYEKDDKGELTGFIVEMGGMYEVGKHIPQFTVDEVKEMIMFFQDTLVSHGITSYTDGMVGPGGNMRNGGTEGENSIKAHKELVEEGRMKCRASLMYFSGRRGVQSAEALEEDLTENYPKYSEMKDPDLLKMDSVKIFCDGDSSAYTGWFYDDYEGQPGNHGFSALPGDTDEECAAELHKQIMIAHKHGLKVGVHCQGDRSAGESIDGMIEAMQAYPRINPRHYIIHADDYATNEDTMRAARYGIGYSAQPGYKALYLEAFIDALGERGRRAGALQEQMNCGVVIAGGADCPSGTYTHWKECAQFAVTRISAKTGIVHHPELRISVEDAIRMFTINGAYQENQEDIRGSIEIGKYADLQVLDKDILTVDPEEISSIKTLLTVLAGKSVYATEEFEGVCK